MRSVPQLVSAGGVVYRRIKKTDVEVVLCGRYDPRWDSEAPTVAGPVSSNGITWSLPKGRPESHESLEQTAKREVQEETGLDVVLETKVMTISYCFTRPSDRASCHKQVHFYLMNAIGGSTSQHDSEFAVVGWFSGEDALAFIYYPTEWHVLKKALELLGDFDRRTQ